MRTNISFRSYAQEECYNRAIGCDEFLIGAKPRFGKTYTACKIVADGWQSNFVVVMSGMNVRNEWRTALELAGYDVIVTTNQELNSIDLNDLDIERSYAFFVSTQKAGMDLYEDAEDDCIPSQKQLVDAFNNFPGIKTLVFDECHFAEQTIRSKDLIEKYHYNKLLYLSGTPYTCSLRNKFTDVDTYKYTYAQEMRDWREGRLTYEPVQMRMFILDKYVSLIDNEVAEGWDTLFQNKESTLSFLKRVIDFAKSQDSYNNLVFVNSTRNAKFVVQCFNELRKTLSVKAISAAGDHDRVDSQKASIFYRIENEEMKFIVTCQRLGTGCTIAPLQSVMFFCPTLSAIRFIQNSMRACSPWEGHDKKYANVVCFNKFNGFGIYNTVASLECSDKKTAVSSEADFDEFTRDFPIFVQDETGLRAVDYIEATDFENNYVHGRTKLFTDMEDINEFMEIFDPGAVDIQAVLQPALFRENLTQEDVNRVVDAYNEGGVEAAQEELDKVTEERGIPRVELRRRIVDHTEQIRERFQKAYVAVVENLLYFNIMRIEGSEIVVDWKTASPFILRGGFYTEDTFKKVLDAHPEYVRCIKRYVEIYKNQENISDFS